MSDQAGLIKRLRGMGSLCCSEAADYIEAINESPIERVERLEEELVEAEAAVKAKRDEDGP